MLVSTASVYSADTSNPATFAALIVQGTSKFGHTRSIYASLNSSTKETPRELLRNIMLVYGRSKFEFGLCMETLYG